MELPTLEILFDAVKQRAEELDHVVGYVLDDLKQAIAEGSSAQHAAFSLRRHYVDQCLSGRVFVIDTFATTFLADALEEEET